jgi:hypothetical protein
VVGISASMLHGRAAEGWLFTVSLPSHAMIGFLVHAILGIRPLEKDERDSDSQGRMDRNVQDRIQRLRRGESGRNTGRP